MNRFRADLVSGVLVSLLFVVVSGAVLNVPLVSGQPGTIYIRADGSLDPSTPLIQRSGDLYTFVGNIYDEIVIERSNVIINGNGYELQGSGSGYGFYCYDINNVTIKNTSIENFYAGIYYTSSNNNKVSGNTITNNDYCGVYLQDSSNNTVSGNTITNIAVWGVNVYYSSNNNVSGNKITNITWGGFNLQHSSNNTVSGNKITNIAQTGVYLQGSSNNTFLGNKITKSGYGVWLYYSCSNNTVTGNTITNNTDFGIGVEWSNNNTISGNTITNSGYGVILGNSNNNTMSGNTITKSGYGVRLYSANNTNVSKNTITNSAWYGIYLESSGTNEIYHNNFINNAIQAYVTLYNNTWDNGYPSGGNYWSDYTGTDEFSGPYQNISGSDFRGDTPYVINQNNTDHYPLTIPYETTPPSITILSPENKTYAFGTAIQLTFTLDEPTEWIGYSLNDQANVTVTGNTTLLALPIGSHHVTLYANDTSNNMGMSTIYFTVLDMTDPIANAGSDKTVNEDVSTTLDGSASTDNVGITGYTWTFTDVTVKTLTGDKPAYTFSNPGVYTITLNVTDAAGNWATDTVVITVLDVTKPVANAGQDQTVNVGATVTFNAGSSTDNVGIVSYEWNFGDEMSGTGKTTTHEYSKPDTYTVTLTVKDAAGNQATDTIVVTVNAAEAFPMWVMAAAGIVAAGIVVAAILLWKRRK